MKRGYGRGKSTISNKRNTDCSFVRILIYTVNTFPQVARVTSILIPSKNNFNRSRLSAFSLHVSTRNLAQRLNKATLHISYMDELKVITQILCATMQCKCRMIVYLSRTNCNTDCSSRYLTTLIPLQHEPASILHSKS